MDNFDELVLFDIYVNDYIYQEQKKVLYYQVVLNFRIHKTKIKA